MAEYQVKGPGGQMYSVEATDNATDAEIVRALKQRLYFGTDDELDTEESEQLLTDEELDFFANTRPSSDEGAFGNFAAGVGSGFVGLYETAALGAATLLEEGNEDGARKVIQDAADALTPEGGDKESTLYKLGNAVGSIVGFLPTALLGPAALPAAAALGVGAAAGEGSERAREAGATEEERSKATLLAAPVGLLEVTPLGRIAKALKMPVVGETVDQLGDNIVGQVTDRIGAGAMREISDRVSNAFVTGGLEGAQETAAEIAQNLIQRGVYDPEQSAFGGVGDALAYGGGAGALVQAFVDQATGRRARTPDSETGTDAVPPRGEDGGPALQEGQEQGELFTPDESIVGPPEGREREEKEGERGEQLDLLGAVEQRDERQGDLFGEPDPIGRATTPDPDEGESGEQLDMFGGGAQDRQLDLFAQEIGLTPEQTQALKERERQTELFDGRAPSADVVPRIEATPSDEQLLAQERELALAGDYEGAARKRTQRLEAGERRDRVAKEAEQQRRTEATLGQVAREDRLAETGTEQARQIAEDRLQREDQLDAFPVDRAIAEQRDEPTRLTRPQQEEIEGLGTVEDAQAQREEVNKRRQTEMFGPRGGVRRPDPAPRPVAVPSTGEPTQGDIFTQEELARAGRPEITEQGEMIGPRGGARPLRADFEVRQPDGRPATASRDVAQEPKPVTKKAMSDMGIPTTAPVRRRIEGLDLNLPENANFVRAQLTDYANTPENNVTQGNKFKITKFLEDSLDGQMEMFDARQRVRPEAEAPTPQTVEEPTDVEPRQPESEPSGDGVQSSRPRAERPEPTDTERTEAPKQERLEEVERDATDDTTGEAGERTPLAEAKPDKKPTRKRTAKVLETLKTAPKVDTPSIRRAKKAIEKKKEPEAPAGKESTTTPKEVTVKDTTVAGAKLDEAGQVKIASSEKKTKAKKKVTPKRTPMRVATEADQKLRDAQEKTAPNVLSARYAVPYRYVGRNVTTDTDKTTVASLLENVADPVKAGKSKKIPKNAARLYFGKKARIEDAIELIAFEIINGGVGQSAYQFTPINVKQRGKNPEAEDLGIYEDVTSQEDKTFFEGLGNSVEAFEAAQWVNGNMSKEARDLLTKRVEFHANEAAKLEKRQGKKKFDFVKEARKAEAKREKARRDDEKSEARTEKLAEDSVGYKLGEEFAEGVNTTIGDKTSSTLELYQRRGKIETDLAGDSVIEDIEYLSTLVRDEVTIPELPKDAVLASSVPLHPEVSTALQDGNLVKALQYIASTTLNKQVRNAALKLAENVGDTKVEVIENLDEAGNFNPQTNTIQLDADAGMNVHTVLHEMAHAATSATLANKSHPMTKQLNKVFESVKEQLDTAYGATNLDEFVAEVFGNPEFRRKLAGLSVKGDKFTPLERVTNAVMNFLRKLVGMQTKPLGTALSEADMLIENILAPAPASRDAGKLQLTFRDGPEATAETFNKYGTGLKRSAEAVKNVYSNTDFAGAASDFFFSAKDISARILSYVLPSQAFLVDVLGYMGIKSGGKLHSLFQEQEADINLATRKLDAVQQRLDRWQKDGKLFGVNQEKNKLFSGIVHNSTIEQVDPTNSRNYYKNNPEKLVAYDAIKKDWDRLDAEGRNLYIELRDTYKKLFEDMREVVENRINSLEETDADGNVIGPVSEADKQSLKEKVFGKLFEKGRIEPYFPLTRKGDFWLEYNIKSTGLDGEVTTEVVSRAFQTRSERSNAIAELDNIPEVIRVDGKVQYEINDDKRKVFNNAPPASFVGQTIKILNKANVSPEVKREFLDMFIDTLPESSFAKSLKKRENKLGFEEDAILAFRTKAYDLGRQTVRMQYNQKINAQRSKILQELKKNPKLRNTSLATILANEVDQRANFAINPPNDIYARAAQTANRIAFFGTIGFNVSSAMVNLSQIPIMVYPYMAAKTSMSKARRNLADASKLWMGSGSESSLIVNGKESKTQNVARIPSLDNYYTINEEGVLSIRTDRDYDTAATDRNGKPLETAVNLHGKKDANGDPVYISQRQFLETMTPLVQEAMNQGQLNHSLFFDTQGLEQSGRAKYSGQGAGDKLMRGVEAVNVISATPFHTAERLNRQVGLAATYLNELQRLTEANDALPASQRKAASEIEAEAVREAIYEIQQTNGGAVLATAPRIAQKHIGRVAMMYKTFGVQMYYTQLKTGLQAIDGLVSEGRLTPEQRRIARRQLIGTLLSVTALSGIQGLTIYGMAVGITNMFLDDDEPDAETQFRDWLGNEGFYKGGVNYILDLAGVEVDVAARIGLSNLIVATDRYNFNSSMEKDIFRIFGGPFYGYTSQIKRGVEDMANGEMTRGVENVLPAAFRNMRQAFRFGDEDALTRRGDPILDDINTSELVAKFFGFTPAEYTRNQERNQARKKIDKAVGEKRTKLLRRLYIARRMGDYDEVRNVMEEIREFNTSRFGRNHIIDGDSISRSMDTHMQTSAKMVNGVTLSPRLRNELLQIGSEWE